MKGPIKYVELDGSSVGFSVDGTGPRVVNVGNWLTNVDGFDLVPALQRYASMTSFAEVAFVDMPGSGSSDSLTNSDIGDRAAWVRALDAVLDSLGWTSATFMGWDMATHPVLAYAVERPSRTDRVVLFNPTVSAVRREHFPLGIEPSEVDAHVDAFMVVYGTPAFLKMLAPSGVADEASCEGWARWQRASASPAKARRVRTALLGLSSVDLVPEVAVPVTVMESRAGASEWFHGSYIAERLPTASYVELPYEDYFPVAEADMAFLLGEVQQVLTGVRGTTSSRQLLAVLFSDIVSSTEQAVRSGDRRWREVIAAHRRGATLAVERAGGRFVKSTGDGSLAVFPSIAAALQAAASLHEAASRDGLTLRIGIHAGDVELIDDDIGGVTVHIAARVQSHAPAGCTALSAATAALVTDGSFRVRDLMSTTLKGVRGEWELVVVED